MTKKSSSKPVNMVQQKLQQKAKSAATVKVKEARQFGFRMAEAIWMRFNPTRE
jgi:hypothetical protein